MPTASEHKSNPKLVDPFRMFTRFVVQFSRDIISAAPELVRAISSDAALWTGELMQASHEHPKLPPLR